jgi:hypothetical protein
VITTVQPIVEWLAKIGLSDTPRHLLTTTLRNPGPFSGPRRDWRFPKFSEFPNKQPCPLPSFPPSSFSKRAPLHLISHHRQRSSPFASFEALADHGRAPEKTAKASNATISQKMRMTF